MWPLFGVCDLGQFLCYFHWTKKIWNAKSGGELKRVFAHFVGRPSPF